jgi:hypothetical protein
VSPSSSAHKPYACARLCASPEQMRRVALLPYAAGFAWRGRVGRGRVPSRTSRWWRGRRPRGGTPARRCPRAPSTRRRRRRRRRARARTRSAAARARTRRWARLRREEMPRGAWRRPRVARVTRGGAADSCRATCTVHPSGARHRTETRDDRASDPTELGGSKIGSCSAFRVAWSVSRPEWRFGLQRYQN